MFKKIWNKWLFVAGKIGNFNSQVLMTVFYLIILLPLGVGYKLFSDTLMIKKKNKKSSFSKWAYRTESQAEARRQY